MEDENKRNEYVMNDQGKVYVGTFRRMRGRPWAFGQFDDAVLPVACYILEIANLNASERGNPVKVVRAISSGVRKGQKTYVNSDRNLIFFKVNSNDNNGIIIGNWSGEYGDGVAPYKWTGSVRILEEYVKKGFRPVKYGQCWVFSAVVTTSGRSIPFISFFIKVD